MDVIFAIISEIHLDHVHLVGKIKAEIKTVNKSYPKVNLAQECRFINLADFLASHEATVIHHTTHYTNSLL